MKKKLKNPTNNILKHFVNFFSLEVSPVVVVVFLLGFVAGPRHALLRGRFHPLGGGLVDSERLEGLRSVRGAQMTPDLLGPLLLYY